MPQATLKIEDTKLGTGDTVAPYDVIEAQYTGTLLTGKEFDSNVKSGKPLRFQVGLGQVIKGWDQGFVGMKVDGERTLTIPPDLGYGAQGAGEAIPPNSTLKFTVKLLRILPRAKITVITPGTGEPIKIGQYIECKLSIKASNGKEIADPTKDSRLQVSRRMLGWVNQMLFGIKTGEKRKVIINYQMAFGEKGVPPTDQEGKKAGSEIPPKSDLTIEIFASKITNE